jgi:hypothetical protein
LSGIKQHCKRGGVDARGGRARSVRIVGRDQMVTLDTNRTQVGAALGGLDQRNVECERQVRAR